LSMAGAGGRDQAIGWALRPLEALVKVLDELVQRLGRVVQALGATAVEPTATVVKASGAELGRHL